tara:strand:+ start:2175 stop:2411 length:237 start_codon:yes stop_codon:yes gene_type:complete
MNQLPSEIINNILIIKMKQLKKENDELKEKNKIMLRYLEYNEIKCCNFCKEYGEDYDILFYEKYKQDLCENCFELKED